MRHAAAALLLVLLQGCAGHTAPRAAAPLAVTRLGAVETYGPGIVSASPHEVRFRLARPAHVILLRLDRRGDIEPVFPLRDDEVGEQAVGQHYVEAPEPETVNPATRLLDPELRSLDALVRAGRAAPDPEWARVDSTTHYWLLVTSDVRTSVSELRTRLEAMRRRYPSVQAELEGLARGLVVARATLWAAYYAAAEGARR